MQTGTALGCRSQGRLGLAEILLGILNPPRLQASLAGQHQGTAPQLDSTRKIPGGHLGLAQRDQSARDPPRIAKLFP